MTERNDQSDSDNDHAAKTAYSDALTKGLAALDSLVGTISDVAEQGTGKYLQIFGMLGLILAFAAKAITTEDPAAGWVHLGSEDFRWLLVICLILVLSGSGVRFTEYWVATVERRRALIVMIEREERALKAAETIRTESRQDTQNARAEAARRADAADGTLADATKKVGPA